MEFLKQFSSVELFNFISSREGETKIGEQIKLINSSLKETTGRFVLLGVPEDIGPKANHGNGGAQYSWSAFLTKFLNMQANHFIKADEIIIAGEVKLDDLHDNQSSIELLRKKVEEIDKRVKSIVQIILEAGKTPIVIGGGHNNCFPIIDSFDTPLHILNIDPHADIRKVEGRHSGNGFTFARNASKIAKYFTLGLHEEYNSQYIFDQLNHNHSLSYYSFNSYLKEEPSIEELITTVASHLTENKIGLEIDLDSIKNMPVSARTPIGFTEEEIRKIIVKLSENYGFHYIHICEGAPTNEVEKNTVGKTIAYLVSDFIKYNS